MQTKLKVRFQARIRPVKDWSLGGDCKGLWGDYKMAMDMRLGSHQHGLLVEWEVWACGRMDCVNIDWCEHRLVWTWVGVNTGENGLCEHGLVWAQLGVRTAWCEHRLMWTWVRMDCVKMGWCKHRLVWAQSGMNMDWCEHTWEWTV